MTDHTENRNDDESGSLICSSPSSNHTRVQIQRKKKEYFFENSSAVTILISCLLVLLFSKSNVTVIPGITVLSALSCMHYMTIVMLMSFCIEMEIFWMENWNVKFLLLVTLLRGEIFPLL